MRNLHIRSAEDKYNDLVDAIVESFVEAFPDHEDEWPYLSVYGMLDALAEAAAYKAKFYQKVQDDLNHSFALMGDVVKAAIELAGQGDDDA